MSNPADPDPNITEEEIVRQCRLPGSTPRPAPGPRLRALLRPVSSRPSPEDRRGRSAAPGPTRCGHPSGNRRPQPEAPGHRLRPRTAARWRAGRGGRLPVATRPPDAVRQRRPTGARADAHGNELAAEQLKAADTPPGPLAAGGRPPISRPQRPRLPRLEQRPLRLRSTGRWVNLNAPASIPLLKADTHLLIIHANPRVVGTVTMDLLASVTNEEATFYLAAERVEAGRISLGKGAEVLLLLVHQRLQIRNPFL